MGALSPERRIARFPRFGVLAGRALLSVLLVLGLLLAVVDGLQDVPFYVSFAAVGAALAVRRPHNSVGWLLLVLSALQVVSSMTLPAMAGPLLSGTAPLAVRWSGTWPGSVLDKSQAGRCSIGSIRAWRSFCWLSPR